MTKYRYELGGTHLDQFEVLNRKKHKIIFCSLFGLFVISFVLVFAVSLSFSWVVFPIGFAVIGHFVYWKNLPAPKSWRYKVPTVWENYQNNTIYYKAYCEMKKAIEAGAYDSKYWIPLFTKMNKEIKEFNAAIKAKKVQESLPATDYVAEVKKAHELYLGALND